MRQFIDVLIRSGMRLTGILTQRESSVKTLVVYTKHLLTLAKMEVKILKIMGHSNYEELYLKLF